MPKRKVSQASLDNLKPGGEAHKLTREEQSRGGKVCHQRRSAQAAIQKLLNTKLTKRQIRQYELMGHEVTGDETFIDLLMAGQARAAVDGSEKCARLCLEYAGEKISRGDASDLIDLLEVIRDSARKKDDDE